MRRALVTGAGGFIGHHLVKRLKSEGFWVRGVDLKVPEFESSSADEFMLADLRKTPLCEFAVDGVDDIYNLAADMGGIGFITTNHAEIARNNSLINIAMLDAAVGQKRRPRFFFSSSACVYPAQAQQAAVTDASWGLREEDAIPAEPEPGYGWEKLYAEQLCAYYAKDYGLDVRVARFHNIYGPLGTWRGGREKAPAAICRKVAEYDGSEALEIWGDGQQTRSFCYVDDCVEGVRRLMESGHVDPINLGSEELVTIDGLVHIVAQVAEKTVLSHHDTTKPQGVRGRNSDNSLLRGVLGWEPSTSLREGIAATYAWVAAQVRGGR